MMMVLHTVNFNRDFDDDFLLCNSQYCCNGSLTKYCLVKKNFNCQLTMIDHEVKLPLLMIITMSYITLEQKCLKHKKIL